jgi:hypothetical protein
VVSAVYTAHVQALIEAGLQLARACDGVEMGRPVHAPRDPKCPEEVSLVAVEHALERAANLLRHAAEELLDERMARLGWMSP